MKKKFLLLLPVIALMGMAIIVKPVNFTVARAEDRVSEVTSEEAPSEEEPSKWKELYEQALAKLEKAKQTEFLGTTVGAVVGAVIVLGLSALANKLNKENIRSLQDFGRNALKTSKDFYDKGKECLEKGQELVETGKDAINAAKSLNEQSKKEVEKMKEQLAEERRVRLEERKVFLTYISNDPTLVANGTAEKLNNLFRKE